MISLDIDKSWTLFLDRDGVINVKRENDYVKNWEEFFFIDGSLEALGYLSKIFGKIVIVTNQRGVGRGIMTENDLINIHKQMIKSINSHCGHIDKIYYCTDIMNESLFRKPNSGMALNAKDDFPEINFAKSIMIGDSISDLYFGKRLGMITVNIEESLVLTDFQCIRVKSLQEFATILSSSDKFIFR